MELLPQYEGLKKLKKKIVPMLQDPAKLRTITVLGIGIIGLIGIGFPLNVKMRGLGSKLALETQRQEVITVVQRMKSKDRIYKKYMNKDGDLNWWIEYILGGIRESNLKIVEYKPFEPKSVEAKPGTWKGYLLQFQLQGEYKNFYSFITWVEKSNYSMRIPRLILQKERIGSVIFGNVTLAVLTSRTTKKDSKKGTVPVTTEKK